MKKIVKFDVVKFQHQKECWSSINRGTLSTETKLGLVVARNTRDKTYRILEFTEDYRRAGGYYREDSVTEVVSSGIEEAIKAADEAGDAKLRHWLRGNHLQRLVRQHKKNKKLLIVTFKVSRYNHGTQSNITTEHEHVIDDVRLSSRSLNVDIVSAPLTGNQNTHLSPDVSSLNFEKDLRVADPTELLTGDNPVGRMFAVHPILQWLPKIEAKFEKNKKVAKEDSRRLKWDVDQLFAHKNVFPAGTPQRVRTLAKKILVQQTRESDLPARFDAILEELEQLYDKIHIELSAQLRAYAAEDS